MSLELRPVQVRLTDEAYEVLRMLAKADGVQLGEVAREVLTDALLGKGHALKLLAARLSSAVRSDKER